MSTLYDVSHEEWLAQWNDRQLGRRAVLERDIASLKLSLESDESSWCLGDPYGALAELERQLAALPSEPNEF